MTPIRAIAAVAENGVIGADGDQPWSHREDFARLKRLTADGVLVMGRRTFEAIGKPLPGRSSFVVTRNPEWQRTVAEFGERVQVFDDVDTALDAAVRTGRPVWVFGGGQIYRAAWSRTEELEITEVHAEFDGDTYFPEIDPREWKETAREARDGFSWVTYRLRSA